MKGLIKFVESRRGVEYGHIRTLHDHYLFKDDDSEMYVIYSTTHKALHCRYVNNNAFKTDGKPFLRLVPEHVFVKDLLSGHEVAIKAHASGIR